MKKDDFGKRRVSTASTTPSHGIMITTLMVSVLGAILLFFVEPQYIFGVIFLIIIITCILKYPMLGLYTYMIMVYLRPQDLIEALVVLRPGISILGLTLLSMIIHNKIKGGKNITVTLTDKMYLAFLVAVVLSNLTSIWLSSSVEMTAELLRMSVFYFVALGLLENQERIYNYIKYYLFSIGFVSLVQIYTYLTVGLTYSTGNGGYGIIIGGATILGGSGALRPSSQGINGVGGYSNYFLANASEFGLGMCLTLPLSFYMYKAAKHRGLKAIFLTITGLMILSIVFCGSRGAFLGLLATMFYMLYKQKKVLQGILVLVLLSGPIYLVTSERYINRIQSIGEFEEDESTNIRFQLWTAAIKMIADYPIFGVGVDNFSVAYGSTYRAKGSHAHYWSPHNVFIQILTETGIVGFAVYIAFIASIFLINRKTRTIQERSENRTIELLTHGIDAALVAYLVAGQFITATYYPYLFQLSVLTSALYQVARKREGIKTIDNKSP